MTVKRILNWKINSLNGERQEVHRSVDGLPAETIATLDATTTTYVDETDVAYMDRIDYAVSSIATIKGIEVRKTSAIISTKIPPNEIHFTTVAGSVNYVGNQGDQILLSNGTIVDITYTTETFTFSVPSGKHVVKLIDSIDRSDYVSVGGEALVELHNFPALSSVNAFDAWLSPNLVKVPTVLPSNLISLTYMFSGATSFNQDISSWDVSNVTQMPNMFNGATTFNQDLSQWCVSNITPKPIGFDDGATNWTLPRPVWGTCPSGDDVVISAIYDGFYQTMTVTGDAGLAVSTKDAQGVVLGLGVIGSDGTVTYPLNIEGQTDNAPIYTKSDFSNTVSHFLVIDTNWDIEYVLDGTTYREVTGNPIPYQHMWKDPERFSSSLVINNTVTVVGQQAFRGWINAVSLTIGDSVQVIHPQAFQYWEALQYLTIPASVTEIWKEAFFGAKSLISITVLAVNPPTLLNVDAFWQGSGFPTQANIYVPVESVGAYKAAPNWSAYANNIFPIPS